MGTLDLQDALVFGNVTEDRGFVDDRLRAKILCDWARPWGIEVLPSQSFAQLSLKRILQGFVREEATFELMYCDFESGVAPIRYVNISHTSLPPNGPRLPPRPPPGDEHGPPRRPGPGRPPFGEPVSAYRKLTSWSFAHAARYDPCCCRQPS